MKYRQLWCSDCNDFTVHKVSDNDIYQHIVCISCQKITNNKIISKRVKVENHFWNCFVKELKEKFPEIKEEKKDDKIWEFVWNQMRKTRKSI